MESKFLLSFIIIITTAVNLQLAFCTDYDSPLCLHELAVEIMEQSESAHCQDPSRELTILVEAGELIAENVTVCEEVTFLCTWNQPITWNYEGIGMPEIGRLKLVRDFDDCYSAKISVRVGPNVSYGKNSVGRYICSSSNAQDNQNEFSYCVSLNLFKADTDPIAFVQPSGINRNISYNGSNELIIPCLANWPYVYPKLLKETVDGLVQINETKYNPRTGFPLQFGSNNRSDALGTYICEIGPQANVSKAVFTVYENGDLDKPIQSEQIVINITRGETCSRFTCESRNKLDHELAFFPCHNIKHCEYQIGYAELAVQFPEKSKSSDICNELNPLPGSLTRNKTQTGIVICREKGGNKYNFAHHYQLVRAPPIAKSMKPEEDLIDGIDATVLDKVYYVNENLENASCYVSDFLFPERPLWLVGLLNGSTLISWGESERSRDRDVTILKQTINITSEEIQRLICAVPRWDSQEWIYLTFPLEIKRGTPPQLVNSSAETVYVNGTDKVDFIFVHYAAGEPIPNITWKRNGEITITAIICCDGNQGEAQINLKGKPAEEAAGLYECEVSNVAGSFTKTINVLMAPPPLVEPGMSPVITTLIAISASAFILLFLVILGKKLGILNTNWWQERLPWIPFRRDHASVPGSPSESNGDFMRIPSSSSVGD